MARIREKTLKFPGLDNTYTFADEADLFDASKSWKAGDYCIYSGDLYKFTVNHTGAWSADDVVTVKLGNEVSTALASSVGQYEQKTIENVAVANFDDGGDDVPVKALIVNVDPVQDLHGYDNPWPAGGNINKFDISNAVSSGTVYGLTITLNATTGEVKLAGIYSGSGATAAFGITTAQSVPYIAGTSVKMYDKNADAIANVDTCRWTNSSGGLAVDLKNMVQGDSYDIRFKPMILDSGITPPDAWSPCANECPITGWTGAKIPVTGKNLFDKSNFTAFDGVYLDSSGVVKSAAGNKAFIIPATEGTYTLSVVGMNSGGRFGSFSSIPQVGDAATANNPVTDINKKATISAPSGTKYFVFVYNNTSVTQTYTEAQILDSIQIELDSDATDYESFNGSVYEIEFPDAAGTVYGAKLTNEGADVWKLRVNKATVALTGDESFQTGGTVGSDYRYGLPLSTTQWATPKQENGSFISSHFKAQNVGANSGDFGLFYLSSTWLVILDKNGFFETLTDFENWLASCYSSGTPIQITYTLATPIEYTIGSATAKTLLGLNNIWADTGNIDTLTYRTMNNTDVKISLTKALIAPVLAGMVAEEALAANDFVIVGNTLYIITDDIAAEGTLTPGTNCTATTIGAQITAILNA